MAAPTGFEPVFLGRARRLPDRRITGLGATLDFHHGLLEATASHTGRPPMSPVLRTEGGDAAREGNIPGADTSGVVVQVRYNEGL